MGFAQNLSFLMESRHYTKYKMAKILECSQSTVANLLNGATEPQRRTKSALATHFGISEDELMGDSIPKSENDWIAQKEAPVSQAGNGLNDEQREIISLYDSLDSAGRAALLADARALAAARKSQGGR